MTGKTRRVVIEKDTFMRGYYSVHYREYKGGKLTYEVLVDYCKKKTDAELIRKRYMAGKIGDVFGRTFKYQVER